MASSAVCSAPRLLQGRLDLLPHRRLLRYVQRRLLDGRTFELRAKRTGHLVRQAGSRSSRASSRWRCRRSAHRAAPCCDRWRCPAAPRSPRSRRHRARSRCPGRVPAACAPGAPRGHVEIESGALTAREVQIDPRRGRAAHCGAAGEQRILGRELLAHDDDLFPLARRRLGAGARPARARSCRNCSLLPQTKKTSSSFSFRSRRSGSRPMAMRIRSAA